MKKLFSLLLLFPLLLHAQVVTHGIPIPSEYATLWLQDGVVYVQDNSLPTKLAGQPSPVIAAAANLHNFALLDGQGRPWSWGDNSNGNFGTASTTSTTVPQLATIDANGNAITGCTQIYCGTAAGNYTVIIKSDGSAWYSGNINGNGVTKFTKLPLPVGTVIVKACAGPSLILLGSKGEVFTAGPKAAQIAQGGASGFPGQVKLPAPAIDIAVGGFNDTYMAYAVLQGGQQMAAWGLYPADYGATSTSSSPQLVKIPGLPALTGSLSIKSIQCNSMTSAAILSDGTLWTWGDNAIGNIGNGVELNFATYKTPYAWDWGPGELMQTTAVQPAPGLRFTDAWGGSGNATFYWIAKDTAKRYYFWGRNKGLAFLGVEAKDQAVGNLGSAYANSWDVPAVTSIDPFALTSLILATSPVCVTNPSALYCPGFGPDPGSAPVVSASGKVSGPSARLTVSALLSPGASAIRYVWVQTSGPTNALLTLPSDPSPVASGLIPGTYTFLVSVTDNNWRVGTAKVSVIVGATPPVHQPPTVAIGLTPNLTWPANGLQLQEAVMTDGGATISSYRWSTPGLTISDSTAAKPLIIFPGPGSYPVSLTVTDNTGSFGSTKTIFTVNPAPAPVVCPPPVICPVCPPIPAPRTVTGVSINTGGQIVPLTQLLPFLLFTYSN